MWLASVGKKQRNALLNLRRGRNGEMERNLMIFKRHPEDREIADAPRDSGVVCYSHENGNFYIASKAETSYQRSDALCIANKKDIFSCLTDEEIDTEYRRRMVGKKIPFAEAPVGSYVLFGGEKWKVVFRGDTYRHKALEIDGKSHLRGIWDMVEICEPPEPKKNEELAELIKSMEEMIETAKKHLEGEE